jgi:hypothetical protein
MRECLYNADIYIKRTHFPAVPVRPCFESGSRQAKTVPKKEGQNVYIFYFSELSEGLELPLHFDVRK